MIPLPIALLALVYAAVATASAVSVWRIASGASQQQLVWPLAWLSLSAAAMCGLALLKPWARRLAIIGLVVITTVVLAVGALLVMAGRPLGALAATSAAALHVVMIRYLQRPSVRAYFQP